MNEPKAVGVKMLRTRKGNGKEGRGGVLFFFVAKKRGKEGRNETNERTAGALMEMEMEL